MITASSLNLKGEDGYPDYLKQIWDAGRYLNDLRNIYKDHGAPLIKCVLADMGVIDDSELKLISRLMSKAREEIKTLMLSHPH